MLCLKRARAICLAIAAYRLWGLQEKPGGDYEISSDSLWELRGESLVRMALLPRSCSLHCNLSLRRACALSCCMEQWFRNGGYTGTPSNGKCL